MRVDLYLFERGRHEIQSTPLCEGYIDVDNEPDSKLALTLALTVFCERASIDDEQFIKVMCDKFFATANSGEEYWIKTYSAPGKILVLRTYIR